MNSSRTMLLTHTMYTFGIGSTSTTKYRVIQIQTHQATRISDDEVILHTGLLTAGSSISYHNTV